MRHETMKVKKRQLQRKNTARGSVYAVVFLLSSRLLFPSVAFVFIKVPLKPCNLNHRRGATFPSELPCSSTSCRAEQAKHNSARDDDVDESILAPPVEVVTGEDDSREDFQDGNDDQEADWLPDREKARERREQEAVMSAGRIMPTPGPYTEEEEQLIAAMGGKTPQPYYQQPSEQHRQAVLPRRQRREEGFLGDSTLQEIATDYSVPVSFLADVLCTWGVPVPINIQDRLGDLVTGEQAFALLEAVNSLDVAALQDQFSNLSLIHLCKEWDINLADAFDMALKEGWNLPFGVQTCLRVEQEDELLRVLGGASVYATRDSQDEYYDD